MKIVMDVNDNQINFEDYFNDDFLEAITESFPEEFVFCSKNNSYKCISREGFDWWKNFYGELGTFLLGISKLKISVISNCEDLDYLHYLHAIANEIIYNIISLKGCGKLKYLNYIKQSNTKLKTYCN